MDAQSMTIAVKGGGMVLLILGGILALWYGFRLFQQKHGGRSASAGFEWGDLRVSARSVGSVVMATAFMWAMLGYLMAPNYRQTADTVEVYSFSTLKGDITAPALTVKWPLGEKPLSEMNAKELEVLFDRGVRNLPERKSGADWFVLDGQHASIQATQGQEETQVSPESVSAVLRSKAGEATLKYQPRAEGGNVVFVPSSVTEYVASQDGVPDNTG